VTTQESLVNLLWDGFARRYHFSGRARRMPPTNRLPNSATARHTPAATGDAGQGITSGMIACTETERNFQDGKLNQAYKMVISRLPAIRQDELRRSERNWIKTRDAICAKELTGEFAGGSMGRVTWLGCLVDETIKRTITLEHCR
jgi:uncharacterized protein YecT (DUF1311 family)